MSGSIRDWLHGLGLERHAAVFEQNDVDLDVLPSLTEVHLKELGISLGDRLRILTAIKNPSDALSSEQQAGGEQASRDRAADDTPQPTFGDGERRQLTVMFCDLVGSTELSTRIDPEDMQDVLRAYHDACSGLVTKYGGYVAKFMGDGVLAYFGFPQAHEDDPERAIHAACEIATAVPRLKLPMPDVTLAVRLGIDTGPVVVGNIIGEGASEEASVVGETPNIAARLQGVAQTNHVVVGPLTKELAGERFDWLDLGEQVLKGVAEPVRTWRAIPAEAANRPHKSSVAASSSPLVGRGEEIGLLVRAWQSSKASQGQVVLIQGEAGLGKSRLVDALRERMGSERHSCIVLSGSPYHTSTTLFPVIEQLQKVAGWTAVDLPAQKLAKLKAILAAQPLPVEQAVPLFADLLSLSLPADRFPPMEADPEEQRERLLDALVGWLTAEAERQPLLVIWEDVHWLDATTIELLKLCIEQCPTLAMMIAITYRPDFSPPWPMRSHMSPVFLHRLDREGVAALLQRAAGRQTMPPEVIDYIVAKTDGVPLYVEELIKVILDGGYLQRDGSDYRLQRQISEVEIPNTLQGLLMARLDKRPGLREVAQWGSILGREFAYDMLRSVSPIRGSELDRDLDSLVAEELLYQRGRRPSAKYFFKHALVQDAAYQSLLKKTRCYYHRRVAELLEHNYPAISETQPELVGYHFSKGGDDEKAIAYLQRAGDKATRLHAHAEAMNSYESARQHAARLTSDARDELVISLSTRQAQAMHFLGRRQQIIELLKGQSDCVARLGVGSLAAEYHFWLGFAHAWLGHRAEANEELCKSLELATKAGDRAVAGRVHRALASECLYSGKPLSEAVAHGREAADLLQQTQDRFWLSQAIFTLSYCQIFAGSLDAAIATAERLKIVATEGGIRRGQTNAVMLCGLGYALQGDGHRGVILCEEALELAPDDFERAFVLACLGRSWLAAGDMSKAVERLEQAVALAEGVRSLQFRAWFKTLLADAYLRIGELRKAADVANAALSASASADFLLGVGLAKHVLGRIAHSLQKHHEASDYLREAVKIFEAVEARRDLEETRCDLANAV